MKAVCCKEGHPGKHPTCPRCKSDETRRLRNYGRPVGIVWWCLACSHRFDVPEKPATRRCGMKSCPVAWTCRTCGKRMCQHYCSLKANDGLATCGACSRASNPFVPKPR